MFSHPCMIDQRPSSTFNSRKKTLAWLRTARYYYIKLIRSEVKPRVMARGLACGVFAGCFPWFGLQTLVGILLAFCFRGNKLAAALGTWISNPFTYAPIFLFNFKIGQLIQRNQEYTPIHIGLETDWSNLIELGGSIIFTLFIGSFVVGLIAGIATYFISLPLITRRRNKGKFY